MQSWGNWVFMQITSVTWLMTHHPITWHSAPGPQQDLWSPVAQVTLALESPVTARSVSCVVKHRKYLINPLTLGLLHTHTHTHTQSTQRSTLNIWPQVTPNKFKCSMQVKRGEVDKNYYAIYLSLLNNSTRKKLYIMRLHLMVLNDKLLIYK